MVGLAKYLMETFIFQSRFLCESTCNAKGPEFQFADYSHSILVSSYKFRSVHRLGAKMRERYHLLRDGRFPENSDLCESCLP
jgi:hypothetical protein